ncbi:MAG TPA: hypothetical protein VJB06_02080 [archaeon]|nr:hypothetical protein [archaeon]
MKITENIPLRLTRFPPRLNLKETLLARKNDIEARTKDHTNIRYGLFVISSRLMKDSSIRF